MSRLSSTAALLTAMAIAAWFPAVALGAQDRIVLSKPDAATVSEIAADRVLEEAYGRLGITVAYQIYPARRALASANLGTTDGEQRRIAGLEKAYPNLIMVPVPIAYTQLAVFTKDPHLAVEGWESLKPYSIGILQGQKHVEFKTQGMNVEPVKSTEQLFKKLESGRNKVVVSSQEDQCHIQRLSLTGISMKPLERITLYHYLHKKHRELSSRLEAVLRQMEQEQVIELHYQNAVRDYLSSCPETAGQSQR